MQLTKKKTAILASVLIATFVAGVIAGYTVWRWTTEMTVLEPFTVVTDLPAEIEIAPDVYHYTINVTNSGGHPLNATLFYTVEKSSENLDVTITPTNGTSITVAANATEVFNIEVDIDIDGADAPATVTINWWIERTSP